MAREWMTAAEIAALKLPGVPRSLRGVQLHASRENWERRPREASGGGWEYRASSLPGQAQQALARALVKAAPAQLPAQLELDLPRTADLKDYQRRVMEARAALLGHLDQVVLTTGVAQGKAILALVEAAREGTLPPELQRLVPVANARAGQGRALSRTRLYAWLSDRAAANGAVVAVAPALSRQEAPIPEWADTLVRLYCRGANPGIAECLEQWPSGVEKPHYDQARRFLKRLDPVTLNAGRKGPKALQQLKAFISRDTSGFLPGTVFIGDGHTFKAEVEHPIHGQPFRPEITAILDVCTRRWVGWSVALAENTWSVADALRHAVTTTTCPDIFYYDNGAGAKNDTWDDELVGLAARLAISKHHSAPWSSQARGIIERFNSTVLHKLARIFPTYVGQRMDQEAKQRIFKITRRQIKLSGRSVLLPTWQDLKDYLDLVMVQYNARSHSALPNIIDRETGKRRHMSPDEAWAMAEAQGWQAEPVSEAEAVDLFRPATIATVNRGWVRWMNNQYFDDALEPFHGEKISVAYDIHDAGRVWCRALDGRYICTAVWNGNRRDYMPKSVLQQAHEKRVAGKLARLEEHRQTALAELHPSTMIEHQRMPEAAPISEAEAAVLAAVEADLTPAPAAQPAPAPSNVPPTSVEDRFRRLLAIEAQLAAGGEVSDVDRAWARRQAMLPDIRAMRLMYEDFKDAALTA